MTEVGTRDPCATRPGDGRRSTVDSALAPRYLIVTQHFPSPESWRGSFVFDFVCELLRTVAPHAWSTAAYLLNRPAARLLQRANTPVCVLADAWDFFRALGLEVCWLRPFPCTPRVVASTIVPPPRPRRANWVWYRALWHVRHALGSRLVRALTPKPSCR